jgi:large subunit ribosomal protein L15
MTDILSRISPPPGARRDEKRVGCGVGSRLGKTCGRGQKGQKARKNGNIGKLHFQGGQTPMQRRLPKRGFRVPFPIHNVSINISDLERFEAGASVDEATLREARLVQGRDTRIKVLGGGELSKNLIVTAHGFSKTALEKIEAAGGKAVITPFGPEPRPDEAKGADPSATSPESTS